MFLLALVLKSKIKEFANKKKNFKAPVIFLCENFAALPQRARQKMQFFWQWTSKNISNQQQCGQIRKSKENSAKSLHPTIQQLPMR